MNDLEKYLIKHKMTRTHLAKLINRHVSYVTHLVKGRRIPSLVTAINIQTVSGGEVPVESWLKNLNGIYQKADSVKNNNSF